MKNSQTKTLIQAFVLMFLSTFLVIVGDTGSKLLSDDGFSQLWVAWTRFAIAAIILLPFSGLKISELSGLLDWRVILRAALICAAISSILTAIKTEPMANAFGGFFVSPIVSYVLSWLLLREKISWERSILLGISFVGVMIVVRPGFGMTTGMMFAVLAGACHGTYLMTTRWLVADYRPRFLLISQLIIGAILMLPFATSDIPSITTNHIGFLMVSALGSAFGNLMLVLTNKSTPASVVAPLVYLQLISATLMGYAVFSQWPDTLTFVGLLIIVSAGLSSLWFAGRGR
jgi:drug/metabolite transporter (DMT)-like permease